MLFNSISFAVFFPIVTLGYFLLPHRFRWLWLLLASCSFYMAFIPAYILILFFTIVIDYFAGMLIETSTGAKRKLLLIASIVSNVGILGFFKYFNFFNANLADLAHFIHWNYSIKSLAFALPIGLSFHTFQAMAYTIEVYRGKQKAERHFGIYALYVMFYPQLVAGPIERPQNLIHQFYEKHDCDYQRVTDGLKQMTWGMFKKVVVADKLAPFVNQIYANPTPYHGLTLIVAAVLFSFQIYADFSGYSSIAIGAAQVMGFKLTNNFNRPYFSKSISEFWTRWHISLSSWIRDYLFIPLSLRKTQQRIYLNLFLVFLLVGLWHGANWTFIAWGALHGLYLIAHLITKIPGKKIVEGLGLNKLPRLHAGVKILATFSLVTFSYIFFRAGSISDALYIARHLFIGLGDLTSLAGIKAGLAPFFFFQDAKIYFLIALASLVFMESVDFTQRQVNILESFRRNPPLLRWAAYNSLVLAIFIFGRFDASKFIYFQF